MLLSVPVEDLLTSQLDINLGHVDGRLSCRRRPNYHKSSDDIGQKKWAGITLNLETVWGDSGYVLSLYASPADSARAAPHSMPLTLSDSSLFSPPDTDRIIQDLSHSAEDAMSLLPPPDYFAAFAASTSYNDVLSPPPWSSMDGESPHNPVRMPSTDGQRYAQWLFVACIYLLGRILQLRERNAQ